MRRLLSSNDDGIAVSGSDKPRSLNADRAADLCIGETTESGNGCDNPPESKSSDEIGESLVQPPAAVDDIVAVCGNPFVARDKLSKALLKPMSKDVGVRT